MVRMETIANLAGVSISTVSNVLNGRSNVGQATRERVLQICEEQGYQLNRQAKKERSSKSNRILFVFQDFDRDFYLKIIHGISDYLTENGYDLVICTNRSSSSFMRSSFASGAICLDGSMTDEAVLAAAAGEFPIVVMDRLIEQADVPVKSVVVNNYPVMCELVQTLVDQGIRRFGYLGGLEHTLDNRERFAGVTDTLEKNNLSFDRKHYYHGNYREQSGYQAAKIIALSHDLPQALVCANDNMAIGAIKAFEESGIRVPEQIVVTGFDDSETSEMAGLTTVTIPRYESGYLAAKTLLEMIDGEMERRPFKLNAAVTWRRSATNRREP
ncbi:LacI family transcriptional regulator [Paenibacillus sp. 598K]|uniref:LacI family DNA-binding transcriptional regulator n=1 Tax=Paenibacillus sp. 598K TaxID=1117987 RepID=UPI000FF9C5B7|nr:LacI family DNA-binding transcriptional regulator [Paenibacillus sp. 598K]GBF77681.1 LacI family transcriptional regulator [Paenibacillus sp. 598K]